MRFRSRFLENINSEVLTYTYSEFDSDHENGLLFLDLGLLEGVGSILKFGILNFACQTKNSGRWLRPAYCSRLA